MPYYRVNVSIIEYDEIYVKAKNKKDAQEKVLKDIFGDVEDIAIEKVSKEEYKKRK